MAARTLAVAAVATAGLVAIGGGTALALGAGSAGPVAPVSLATSAAAPAPGIDPAAAERIALDRVGGGRITDRTERDDEHGRPVWDVEVTRDTTEHDLDVDVVTGEIVEHHTDDLRGDGHGTDHLRGNDDHGDDHGGSRDDDRPHV